MTARHLCCWPGCREMVKGDRMVCFSHYSSAAAPARIAIQRAGGDRRACTEAIAAWLKHRVPLTPPARPFSEPQRPGQEDE